MLVLILCTAQSPDSIYTTVQCATIHTEEKRENPFPLLCSGKCGSESAVQVQVVQQQQLHGGVAWGFEIKSVLTESDTESMFKSNQSRISISFT